MGPNGQHFAQGPLTPVAAAELERVSEMCEMIPESLLHLWRDCGSGKFFYPNQNVKNSPREYRIFTVDECLARRASAVEQIEDELNAIDVKIASCFEGDTGHETGDDCRRALEGYQDFVRTFLPFMGPDDVYDFVYVAIGGLWHGRVGRWYHDYPVCELLAEPPQHEHLDAFGDHFNICAAKLEPII